jgi:hypothetical protein
MWQGSILAAFVYPGLFAAGAGAVALPILIHILARRRFKRIRWAAMDFLIDAEKRNRRRVRLEQWILLALRCLAILLISLVVSRPFLRPAGWSALLGGPGRNERVFVLDDSFSMGYTAGPQSNFDSARKNLMALLTWVRNHSAEDAVTVVRASSPDVPLVSGALLDEKTLEELRDRIGALQPSEQDLQPEKVLQSVAGMLAESDTGSATVFLVSDFQRVDWLERSAGAGGSPFAPLKEWSDDDHSLHVVLVAVGDAEAQNRAVVQIEAAPSGYVAGIPGQVGVSVANFGAEASDKLEAELRIGPTLAQSVSLPGMAAGQTITEQVQITFPGQGVDAVHVSLPPDGLPVDDARSLGVRIEGAFDILVVNGKPSSDPYRDEAHLLETALQPQGEVFSGNRVQTVEESVLDGMALHERHLVVLANVFRLSEPAIEKLRQYVAGGGGLLVFLGDQVDPAVYNATLHDEDPGLLPVRLGEIVQPPAGGVTLAEGDFPHPVVRVFAGQNNPFVNEIRFDRYFSMEAASRDEAAEAEGDTSMSPASEILARFSDGLADGGTPAIVEGRVGAGRVMVINSSAGLEWNNWARDPSYVVTMLEIARYLARRDAESVEALVGDPIEFSLAASEYQPQVVLRTPSYPMEQELLLTAVEGEGGRGLAVRWEQAKRAGLYRFELTRQDGSQEERLVAVNLEPRESDLSVATESDLRRSMPELAFDYFESAEDLAGLDETGRKELWPGFLVAAMVVLMGEQLLAFWFGRRS